MAAHKYAKSQAFKSEHGGGGLARRTLSRGDAQHGTCSRALLTPQSPVLVIRRPGYNNSGTLHAFSTDTSHTQTTVEAVPPPDLTPHFQSVV